ncbi:MAG TPA: hypothetical protein VHG11_08775 [Pseudorhizobium sp.]|jgi:hypothetical protein|nr:hypothetical protein [Pseudorhizobium sp.]
MEQALSSGYRLPLFLLGALLLTGLSAAAFYGWIMYGSSMLLTLAQNGLSGCL